MSARPNLQLITHHMLLVTCRYEVFDFAITIFTDAGDDQQLFFATKFPVARTVLDDARGVACADSRQSFKFVLSRAVDVNQICVGSTVVR